ncbi:MAG: gamma-glutamyltransferase [bacterium]|nr:gamma-glutamyltransferase [bacterium]
MNRTYLAALSFVAVSVHAALAQDRIAGMSHATRSIVWAKNGIAATSHPLATQVAIDILKQGGSAVDAAIAANAALGVCEPTGCGIGGDLFAIVWDGKTKKLHGLNASGRSPRALTRQWFLDQGHEEIPKFGPLPVSVPGCVDGWYTLHGKFGKLAMAEVLEPAIRYAEQGVPVPQTIAEYWRRGVPDRQDQPGFREVFLPWGRPPREGDTFQNDALARTMRQMAERGAGGRDLFYLGAIAQQLATFVQEHGGFLTAADLAAHTSEWIEPVSTNYRGYDVWELPPNGQGIAALQILNLIEPFEIASMGAGSAAWAHLFVEAKKLVYEDRAKYYADMAFAKVPVKTLISKAYADERRKLFDPKHASLQLPAGDAKLEKGDTIYLTVADEHGTMVSLIQSNFRGLGSGVCPPQLGFGLQNRGELFDLRPGRANTYAPGKRPFHTIIPAFVTRDGEPWLSFGVMGGAMQPQGHVQILVNMIDFGMNLQEAGDAARIRHEGSSQPTGSRMRDGGTVYLESTFSDEVAAALRAMGHRVERRAGGFGGYQAVLFDAARKVYAAASESRKDGHAAGY